MGHVTVVVRDYDGAIAFYTGSLGFDLVEDTPLGHGRRWVLARPPSAQGTCLLLATAVNAEQAAHIGNQTGGRRLLFHPQQTLRSGARVLFRAGGGGLWRDPAGR